MTQKMIEIDPQAMDWNLLKAQKQQLLKSMSDGNILMGIVHLIDDIQDQAVDKCGIAVDNIFMPVWEKSEEFTDLLQEIADKIERWGHTQCSADLVNAAKRLREGE